MAQDKHQRAKERWSDATDHMREQHARMLDDMRFSNPADPQQWDPKARELRKGRPCLTFDRTNQFIAQVVNDGRQNKPAIHCLPADSNADVDVAEKLNGLIRHIEYVSRAGIAYDTALEHSARCGLGWIRVIPEVMRPETNEQEIRIKRVHDPLSVKLDPNSTEPDGSDAMWGMVETTFTKREFERQYPDAALSSWDSDGWFADDSIRICEEFYVEEEQENRITVELMGQSATLTEDEYWRIAQTTGVKPRVIGTSMVAKRRVKWCKFSGAATLEETDFPSQFLPLIPVMGYEVWIEGKRYLCGMTRRMMDSQRFHNFAVSAAYEAMAVQPKAPYLLDERAIDGHEDEWAKLNSGNPAYLPYNGADEMGPINPPQRLAPPQFGSGISALLAYSGEAMESSIGMFKANLGQSGNETSGRAIMARQREGDTANFHYLDNLNRSIEQLGRVIVDMIPRIYDTQRQARIIGEDGQQDFVDVNPEMPQAVRRDEKKRVIAINPGVGAYDVRVKAGPSYTTLRQQTAEALQEVISRNPAALQLVGDVWVKMQDWPEADKVAKRFKAMLPPQLQALEEEGQEDIPPELIAQMQGMQQQLEQMQQALQQAGQEVQKAQQEAVQAKFQAQATSLDKQAALLKLQEQQAITRVNEAIQAGQPTPEAPGVPPELEQMAREVDEGLKEIQHARELLKKDEQIAILRIEKAEQGLVQAAQPAQEAEEPGEMEEPESEDIKLLYSPDGGLIGAMKGAKRINITRELDGAV